MSQAATPFALVGSDGIRLDLGAGDTCKYMGITVRETAGAAAVLRIRVGTSSGTILDTIYLAANDSVTTWYADGGKLCRGDLYEDYVSGTYEGSVFVC